ncbi:hypothetical protein PFISCL1PPCAC_17544, partial [Pristionchus fissidentatus]
QLPHSLVVLQQQGILLRINQTLVCLLHHEDDVHNEDVRPSNILHKVLLPVRFESLFHASQEALGRQL